MYKFLIDSDALIKISKAEFLDKIVQNFYVLITEDVYDEAVTKGKIGFYQDADKIDKLVKDGKIKIIKSDYYKKRKTRETQRVSGPQKSFGFFREPKRSFGSGEISIFQAYKKYNLIVTDDLSFTLYLRKENILSISSAHLILILYKKTKISKSEAYYCLERLKPFIRKEIYEVVKKDIGG